MARRRATTALLAALLVAGCSTPSVREEQQIARQAEAQVRQQVVLLNDDVVDAYVDAIGDRLAAATDDPVFPPEFTVVRDDQINAFATWGGSIYVNTGLIRRARNVSELAGVLAHELGHVQHRDVAENYARAKTTGALQQLFVLGVGVFGGGAAAQAANLLTSVSGLAYLNTFTREAEAEADAFAVEILPRAGFDPRGIVTMFETLRNETGGRSASFLSSHPAPQERIDATEAKIRALGPLPHLERYDDGRLEIIQRRIDLLAGRGGRQRYRLR